MDQQLLTYYEAIEKASADMLLAAREGNWDEVVKLEGACVLLISQLKLAAQTIDSASVLAPPKASKASKVSKATKRAPALKADPDAGNTDAGAGADAARAKTLIMQRILVNDAEIRNLAEPWLQDLSETMAGRRRTLH